MKKAPVIVVQFFHIRGPVPLSGKETSLYESSISIGRHPSCQLRFSADLTHISRQHAEIVKEGNQFKLIDRSTNGTFVNGKRVKEVLLKDGDVLMFGEGGPQVSFLTQVEEGFVEKETPPAKPLREPEKEVRRGTPPKEAPQPLKRPLEEKAGIPTTPEVSLQPTKAPLIIQYGPTIRSFKQLPILIGKSPKCEYPLDHPALSDQHAQVFFSENQYWVKDLTGQNLVRINRQPIGFQAPLKSNDELALTPQGPLFRFFGEGRLGEIEETPEESPPESPEKTGAKAEEKSISAKFKKIFKS